jgi:hypothetical protein
MGDDSAIAIEETNDAIARAQRVVEVIERAIKAGPGGKPPASVTMEARGAVIWPSATIRMCACRTQTADPSRSRSHVPAIACSFHAGDRRFESGWGYLPNRL